MSKFDYGIFHGGFDELAVSKEKYSKEEAIEIAVKELLDGCLINLSYLAIGEAFVRHRAGTNEEHEPCVCWWLEYEEHKRSCPCWVFHTTSDINEHHKEDYEYYMVDHEKVKKL